MIAIYSRKSKYTGKGESIENQIQLCREHATKYLGAEEKDIVIYEDEGFSGGNTNRPQFTRLLEDVKQGKLSTLICYRLDRISRNVADFSSILEMLIENKVDFVSIKESFDTSTPMGKAMVYISSVFAQLERETLAERVRDNMYELAKTGRWLGGASPLGFSSMPVTYQDENGKTRKYNILSSEQAEKDVIQLLFNEFIKQGSISKLQQFAYTHGLKSKNGKDFHINCLKGLLSNPVYCVADSKAYNFLVNRGIETISDKQEFNGEYGLSCYNKTSKDSKKITRPKDYAEWIIAVGKHEGLIDSATWIKAQKIIMNNRDKAIRQVRNPKALLSGLLYCKHCGSHLRPKYHNYLGTADDDRKYYYICEMKERSKKTRCNVDNINGNFLDKMFIDELHREFGLMKCYDVKNEVSTEDGNIEVLLKGLNEQLQETNKAINSLLANLSQGAYEKSVVDVIMEQMNTLTAKKQEIEKEINELQAIETKEGEIMSYELSLKDKVSMLNSALANLSVFERRDRLRTIINKILWDGDDIEILLQGA